MKLNYSLDISDQSTWYISTPNTISQRMPFYINECGHYIANRGYYTERQGQANYLLIYTLSGTGYLKYTTQEYILESSQAIVIDCDRYHFYKTYSKKSWDFKWIHFNGTSAKAHYDLLNGDSINLITVNNTINVEQCIDDVIMCSNSYDIPSIVKASSKMNILLSSLIASKFSPANNNKYNDHIDEIEKVIRFIHLNYHKKISLYDLTKKACLSKYYFTRIFKRHIGISPYEYLINYRIKKAKDLLITTHCTVWEICDQIGFFDYDNFIRAFKKNTGITPMKYRNNR